MKKLNPCVTGDTKVWTVDGVKSFKELAELNDDVLVYCLGEDGNIKISKMLHPRITGYNMDLMKITLEDGTVLKVTQNHMFLTDEGYIVAEDLMKDTDITDGDKFEVFDTNMKLPDVINPDIIPYTEYTGTKKGTVLKKCEVTGDTFECTWDEREICAKDGCEIELYEKIDKTCDKISKSVKDFRYCDIKNIEKLDHRENVYNGTVAVYHNYFTVDENTNTVVNQLNCGE